MSNFFLKPLYKNIQLKTAQTIFADNRAHHIGKLSLGSDECSNDFKLINTYKNFSLPVTILNKSFEISRKCEEFQSISHIYSKMDVLVSFFNLSSMDYDERYDFVKQMQKQAPKALFIEYENPERNITCPVFYGLIAGEYVTSFTHKMYTKWKQLKNKEQLHLQDSSDNTNNLKNYLKNGALEGFIHDIPNKTGQTPTIIKREHLYAGGIGLLYCEW